MTLMVLLLVSSPVLVHAKCVVKNRQGVLQKLDILPYGVNYYEGLDMLECIKVNACREWIISGCDEVKCVNRQTCQDAQLIDNQIVSCRHEASCQDAHFYKAHLVNCGGPEAYFADYCRNSVIEIDDRLICEGPKACVSKPSERLIVKAGAKGQVRCGNMEPDSTEFSCQNMIIEISHSKRACFDRYGGLNKGCAAFCVDTNDCDEASIQFVVSGEQPGSGGGG
ncbi:hypothetical protein ACA910_011202 [Epithemia clementina (nom. ined.)]